MRGTARLASGCVRAKHPEHHRRDVQGYFFVNCMITISAVAFLYNTRTMPLSIMINQLEGEVYVLLEAAAFVSLVILLSNIVAKILIGLVKKFCQVRYGKE